MWTDSGSRGCHCGSYWLPKSVRDGKMGHGRVLVAAAVDAAAEGSVVVECAYSAADLASERSEVGRMVLKTRTSCSVFRVHVVHEICLRFLEVFRIRAAAAPLAAPALRCAVVPRQCPVHFSPFYIFHPLHLSFFHIVSGAMRCESRTLGVGLHSPNRLLSYLAGLIGEGFMRTVFHCSLHSPTLQQYDMIQIWNKS